MWTGRTNRGWVARDGTGQEVLKASTVHSGPAGCQPVSTVSVLRVSYSERSWFSSEALRS